MLVSRTVDKERVVIRIAGDSGDGMQLAGGRFTDATAVFGNDLSTAPDYPAEVRAPTGTVRGVSAFQIHFASRDILTPGDTPDVLVAMNPAALKSNLDELENGSTIVVNEDAFNKRNLVKAGYDSNPLEDGSLAEFSVHALPMTSMTVRATESIDGVSSRDAARSKNLFALGVLSWMYGRPVDVTEQWIEQKFAKHGPILTANLAAFHAGYNFAETTELLDVQYRVKPAASALRHLPQRRRHHRHRARTDRGERHQQAAAVLRQLSRSPPPRSCCTSSRASGASACAWFRPRTRSPRRAWRSAPRSGASSG